MDMTQLSCFLAVADSLNFAKAAESLHLSQSAVSKRIKSLEEEVGTLLFERSTRHVRLTDAGRIFYPHAKNLLVHEKNIINSLAQMDSSGVKPVFVGSYSMEIYLYIHHVIRNVHTKDPDILPDIVMAAIHPLNSCLETHAIDLILGHREMLEHAGIRAERYKELSSAPLKLMYEKNLSQESATPLYGKDITPENTKKLLGLDKLILYNELEAVYMKYPELTNILFAFSQKTIRSDNMESAISLAKAGLGILLLPLSDAMEHQELASRLVEDIRPFSYGYFRCKSNMSSAANTFVKELETYFK